MTFFFKVSGDWTVALGRLLSEKSNLAPDQENQFASAQGSLRSKEIMCRVRGPYGSPAQHVGQFDKVVLISGGVGGTPYLSVVKDIVQFLDDVHYPFRTVPSTATTTDSTRDLLDIGYHDLSYTTNSDIEAEDSGPEAGLADEGTDPKRIHMADERSIRASILCGALYISNMERLYNFLSSTTIAFFVLWLEIIRFLFTMLAFAVNQDITIKSFQGLQVLPFGFQVADLMLATLIVVPTVA
jgi:hypothetical protein